MYNLIMEYSIILKNGTKIGPKYFNVKNLESRSACMKRVNNILIQINDIMDGVKGSYFDPDPFNDLDYVIDTYKGKYIAHIHFEYEIQIIGEKPIAEETK